MRDENTTLGSISDRPPRTGPCNLSLSLLTDPPASYNPFLQVAPSETSPRESASDTTNREDRNENLTRSRLFFSLQSFHEIARESAVAEAVAEELVRARALPSHLSTVIAAAISIDIRFARGR